MVDVNAAAPAAQPIVLGNKLLTPGADGKSVKISEKDGSNAQSMDLEAFKKYLAEHKEEIIAASKQGGGGDTVNFKGHGDEGEAKPEKKGLSTGTVLLGAAALVGVGIWKKDLVAKYWKQFTGLFNKKAAETAAETSLDKGTQRLYMGSPFSKANGAYETKVLDKEIKASQSRVAPSAHSKKEAELVETIQAFEKAEKRSAFELKNVVA